MQRPAKPCTPVRFRLQPPNKIILIKFLFKSAVLVSIFSLIRFLLNLYFASFLYPSDFGMILLPILVFGFVEILVEGGYYTSIVKFSISNKLTRIILNERIKFGIKLSLAILLIFLILNYIFDTSIPNLVIISYCIATLLKVIQFIFEAKLTSDGKYIQAEFIGFATTVLLTFLLIYLIPLTDIPGYYFLSILAISHPLITSLALRFLITHKENELENEDEIKNINIYSLNVRNSSVIDFASNKVDEIFLIYFLSPALLGLLSKIKELYFLLGSFTSKIISRPWLYISSRAREQKVFFGYFCFSIFAILVTFLCQPFFEFILLKVLSILGENWQEIFLYISEIVLLTLSYFLVTFSRMTILGLGGADLHLRLDIFTTALRFIVYITFFMYFYAPESFKISSILFIEMILRSLTFFIQAISVILISNKKFSYE